MQGLRQDAKEPFVEDLKYKITITKATLYYIDDYHEDHNDEQYCQVICYGYYKGKND